MPDGPESEAAAHLVHGMTEGAVEPDWPPLDGGEVRAVLAAVGGGLAPAPGDESVLVWHSPRPFSAAAIVDLGDGERVLVKRHHRRVRSREEVGAEQRYSRWLLERGVPAAAPLGCAEIGEFVYEVQRSAPGVDRYREAWSWTPYRSPLDAGAAGRMLARLHNASEGYEAPVRAAAPLLGSMAVTSAADPLDAVAEMAAALPGLDDYLAQRDWRTDLDGRLTPLHAALAASAPALPALWTHNDWHPSNLFWAEDPDDGAIEVTGVIDFGLSNKTTAIYDLATAIERSCIGWLQPTVERLVHLGQIGALLEGYRAVRPLTDADMAALSHLLPIVHVEYALSEIDYFHGVVGSSKNADLAYEDYLLGHLDWFAGAAGREVQAAIEAL